MRMRSILEAVFRPELARRTTHKAQKQVQERSIGVHNILTHCTVFQLCDEEERKMINKNLISCLVFSNLITVRETNRVDLVLEYQREVGYKFLALICFVYWELLLYLMYW